MFDCLLISFIPCKAIPSSLYPYFAELTVPVVLRAES